MKGDRRLVEYQKKYEQRIQFLMNKLRDAESNEAPDERITYVELETQGDSTFFYEIAFLSPGQAITIDVLALFNRGGWRFREVAQSACANCNDFLLA